MRVLLVSEDRDCIELVTAALGSHVELRVGTELDAAADLVVLELPSRVLEDPGLTRLPFIAIVGDAHDSDVTRAYELGARACFVKPVVPEILRGLVDALAQAIPAPARPAGADDLQQFVYSASHDLQEPLRMVSSFTQLLAERYGSALDERARQYIDFAQDGAKRMRRLIADLLAFSRVHTEGRPLRPVDASVCFARALAGLDERVRESGAVIDGRIEARVLADDAQLELVFRHLLDNALAFRRDDPPRVHVEARREGSRFVLSVRDEGTGIAPELIDRVFGLFQRGHRRPDHAGTGIGLAVCRRVVERHGGTIRLESDGHAGTTVHVSLRAANE
jgi:light-regulated signal transduction histidine kinase (bacteriophytochrome)